VLKVLQELRPGQLTFTLEQDIAVWANRLRGEIGYRPAHADELAHASEEFRKLNQAADVIISQQDSADANDISVGMVIDLLDVLIADLNLVIGRDGSGESHDANWGIRIPEAYHWRRVLHAPERLRQPGHDKENLGLPLAPLLRLTRCALGVAAFLSSADLLPIIHEETRITRAQQVAAAVAGVCLKQLVQPRQVIVRYGREEVMFGVEVKIQPGKDHPSDEARVRDHNQRGLRLVFIIFGQSRVIDETADVTEKRAERENRQKPESKVHPPLAGAGPEGQEDDGLHRQQIQYLGIPPLRQQNDLARLGVRPLNLAPEKSVDHDARPKLSAHQQLQQVPDKIPGSRLPFLDMKMAVRIGAGVEVFVVSHMNSTRSPVNGPQWISAQPGTHPVVASLVLKQSRVLGFMRKVDQNAHARGHTAECHNKGKRIGHADKQRHRQHQAQVAANEKLAKRSIVPRLGSLYELCDRVKSREAGSSCLHVTFRGTEGGGS